MPYGRKSGSQSRNNRRCVKKIRENLERIFSINLLIIGNTLKTVAKTWSNCLVFSYIIEDAEKLRKLGAVFQHLLVYCTYRTLFSSTALFTSFSRSLNLESPVLTSIKTISSTLSVLESPTNPIKSTGLPINLTSAASHGKSGKNGATCSDI